MGGLHRTYHFTDGRLVKVKPPEWFAKATAVDGNWPSLLTAAGATFMEEFGDGDLEIFEGPEGDYFVGIWDSNKCMAEVFIDNVADYLQFRVSYIAPLANLIMETERHYEWNKAKKRKATS